jgi:hypothetical protein
MKVKVQTTTKNIVAVVISANSSNINREIWLGTGSLNADESPTEASLTKKGSGSPRTD